MPELRDSRGRPPGSRATPLADATSLALLPVPPLPAIGQTWGIVVAGIGGTGIVTIGGVLGMAAHLEGKGVITQDATGMAQMGGATWSHIQIADSEEAWRLARGDGQRRPLDRLRHGGCRQQDGRSPLLAAARTFVALNTHATPTAAFVGNPDWESPGAACADALVAVVGEAQLGRLDAEPSRPGCSARRSTRTC